MDEIGGDGIKTRVEDGDKPQCTTGFKDRFPDGIVDHKPLVIGMKFHPTHTGSVDFIECFDRVGALWMDRREGDEPIAVVAHQPFGKGEDRGVLFGFGGNREDDSSIDMPFVHPAKKVGICAVGRRRDVGSTLQFPHRPFGEDVGKDMGMKIKDHRTRLLEKIRLMIGEVVCKTKGKTPLFLNNYTSQKDAFKAQKKAFYS